MIWSGFIARKATSRPVVSNSTCSESDLPTLPAEDRTRTVDTETPGPADIECQGPVTGDLLRNRFVLHECLASSPARGVFRALDLRRQAAGDANPWVVLKVVTASPGHEPRALLTLRREAAISQGLEHPNLPWVRGLDRDGPHTFLCLTWLPGQSLATMLDLRGTRPMIPAAAVNIIEGIGHALTYLHRLGITHADVKPGNILVSAEGHATLLDLGVALGPDSGDQTSAHGYTPQYASPEVLNGALPTPADDLFSLACVAYRMLTGRRAFGEANACEAAASGERPARPDNISPAQWCALDQALAFRRADRQRDVQSFLAQLGGSRPAPVRIVDPVPDPVAAQPVITTPPAADRRWNPGRWWPAAALVAVSFAVATLFLNRRPDSPPPTAAEAPTAAPVNPAAPAAPVAVKRNPARKVVAVAAGPRPQAPRPRPVVSRPESGNPPRMDLQQPDRVLRESPAPGTPIAEPAAVELLPEAPAAAARPTPDRALPDTAVPPAADGQRVAFSRLKVRRYVEPKYPRNALTRRVAGWVEVAFTVDTSGRTRDARVINADPPGIFEDAALTAVRRWRFDTAGSNAAAAPVDSEIRLRFQPQ